MLKSFLLIALLCGCQTLSEYDPVAAGLRGEYPINQNGFALLQQGLSMEKTHEIMGEQINFGEEIYYNPYKTETWQGNQGVFTVEYYITRIEKPDNIVDDDELMPVIFLNDQLYATGWSALKSILPTEKQ